MNEESRKQWDLPESMRVLIMVSEKQREMIGESESRGFEQAPRRASWRLRDVHEDPAGWSECALSDLLSSFLEPQGLPWGLP